MSAVKETLIFCDGRDGGVLRNDFTCPQTGPYADGDSRSLSAVQQRASYRKDGWRYIDGKDYCPACVKAIRALKRREGTDA